MSYMITLHFKRMYILLYTVCKHCLRGGYTFGVTFVSLDDIDEGKSLVHISNNFFLFNQYTNFVFHNENRALVLLA